MKNRTWILILGALTLLATVALAEEGQSAADLWNKTKIVTAYTLNTRINPFDLEVEVRDGTAFLTGTVRTEEEKQLAEQLALSVEGIDKVNNEILLDANIPQNQARFDLSRAVSDANITAMVKSQLLWNDLTHALKINVSTNNGVVTLAGPVSSEEEAEEVLRIAQRTRMVEGVDNQLQVGPQAAAADSGR